MEKKITFRLILLFLLGSSLIPVQALAKPAPGIPGPIPNDVLIVPPSKGPSQAPILQEAIPQTPQTQETSEYMAGSVAVGIIFPESTGASSTEDWTTAERNNVISEIQEAFNWWVARSPANTNLSFSTYPTTEIRVVSTGYEPINHDQNFAQTWVADVLGNMGYSSGDHLDRSFAYDNWLKNNYNTDWAFTIFIVDSSNDGDGQFTDGTFAWAWLGGPYMIMTYDNATYTISKMAAVCAHEMGHIFYALDEYSCTGEGCSSTARSGYLNVINGNYEGPHACIMKGGTSAYNSGSVCSYTREQIGWRDSDSDGVLDIFDLSAQTNLTAFSPDPTSDHTPTYNGSASIVEAYPNNNPESHYGAGGGSEINIDTISGVQYRYRLGAGSWSGWLNSTANDGTFNGQSENFSFTTPTLADGTYDFEVKAVTYFGSEDSAPATDTLTIAGNSPTCTLTSPTTLTWYSGTITLSADASDPDGTVSWVEFEYSWDDSIWSPCAGSPDSSLPYSIRWASIPSDGTDSTVWIMARARDNAGLYSSWAKQQIKVDNEAPGFSNWLKNPADLNDKHIGSFQIRVDVTDSGIGLSGQIPQLDYRLGAAAYNGYENMTLVSGTTWSFSINLTWADYGGQYLYYRVQAGDGLGNTATSSEQDELIERINDPPTCTLTSPSANAWYRGTIALTASAGDPDPDGAIDLVEFDYSLDHSSWSSCSNSPVYTSPYSIDWASLPSDGTDSTVWIRARAKDNEGDYSGYDEQPIKIDNQPPSTTDDYDVTWHKQDFTINITGNDGDGSGLENSDIRYRINGGAERNLSAHGQPVISTEGGDNQLEYWGIDQVGNEESHHNLTGIKLDKTGPVFGPYTLDPPYLTEKTSGPLTVSLTVNDTLSGIIVPYLNYRLDSTNYDGYEVMTQGEGDTWSFSILPPGTWADHQEEAIYWRVRCNDLAGNESVAEEGSEFIETVNDTPTCRITSPDSFTWQAGRIVITAEATDEEAMDSVEFVFSLDGQDWQEVSGSPVTSLPYQLTWNSSPADGVDTRVYLRARAWDLTGLDSGWDTVAISVDNRPPQTFASTDTSSWYTSDLTISLEAGDGTGSGIFDTYYQINGGETRCLSLNGLPVISTEGTDNSLTYWSIDQVGNQEKPGFLSGLKLDKTPPGIISWSLDPEDLTEDSIGPLKVAVTIKETLSGSAGVEFNWRIGDAACDGYEEMTAEGDTWSATIPEPELWDNERGKNIYVQIRATDVAGNEAFEEITELIDSINDPPVCRLIYPAEPDWYAGIIEIQAKVDDPDNAINRVEFQYYREGRWEDCAGSPVSTGTGAIYSLAWSSQPANSVDTGVVLRVMAADEDGLASGYDTGSIGVDNQPPVTTAIYQDIWHPEAFYIPLLATDGNGGGVETTTYRINSGPEINDTQPLINLEGTNNRLTYWSIDKLGNRESSKSLTGIKLDLTPPVISNWVKYPPDLTEDSVGHLTVYVSVTDTLSGFSGIPQFDYRLGSQAYDGYEDMTSQGGKSHFFSIPEPGLWDNYRGETISFKVKAADVAGNIIESSEQEELIDSINDPPFCRLIGPAADNWYRGDVTLSAEAIDSDGKIVKVEFAYFLAGEWFDLPPVTEPPYQLEWDSRPDTGVAAAVKIMARSQDNEGSYSKYDEIRIRIDNEAPVTSHDYDGNWQTQDFTITLIPEDGQGSGAAGTYYRINEGEEKDTAAYGQPVITTERDNNILEYWSVDVVGNQESFRILTGIKLDKSPPPPPIDLTADDENPSPWKNSPDFIIDWTDPPDLSGIAYTHYQLDSPPETGDEGESTTLHPFEIMATRPGEPSRPGGPSWPGGPMLYLWLEDNLGQQDYLQVASVELRYETTPPDIGAFSTDPLDLTEDTSGPFRIEVEVRDEGGSGLAHVELAYQIEASGWSEFSTMTRILQEIWSTDINPQSAIRNPQSPWDGVRGQVVSWQVRATDQAGNVVFSSIEEELIDDINDSPTCSWIQPEADIWHKDNLSLKLDCQDQDGKIDRVFIQVSLDNGQSWPDVSGSPITSPPYTLTWNSLPARGINPNVILRARARDDEGTYSAWAERSIKVDNQAPVTMADYEPGWRRQDFTIELTADDGQGSGVEDIYYRINDGREQRVSLDGQPLITTEWPDNTLAYWAIDQVGHKESPEKIEGIGLDRTAPTIADISQEPADLTEHFEGDLIVRVTAADEGGSGIADCGLQIADCSDCGLQIESISDCGFQITSPAGGWEVVAGKTLTYRIRVEDVAGNVTLSAEQIEPIKDAPTITLLTPPAEGVAVKDNYQISWNDEDMDDDAAISLFYESTQSTAHSPQFTDRSRPWIGKRRPSAIRNPQSAFRILIVSGLSEDDEADSYLWDTSQVAEGQYRVSSEITDGRFSFTSLSPGFIRIDHTPPALEWVTANQDGFLLHLADESLPLSLEDTLFAVAETDTSSITLCITKSYLDENDSGLVQLEVEGMRASTVYTMKVDGIKDRVGNQTPLIVVNDIIFIDPTEESIITRSDGTGLNIPAGAFDEPVTLFMDLSPSSPELEEADRAAEADPSLGYLVPETTREYRVTGEDGDVILPDGFHHPVRVTIPYPADLPVNEQDILIYRLNGTQWIMTGSIVDRDKNKHTLSAEVPHLSIFRIAEYVPLPAQDLSRVVIYPTLFDASKAEAIVFEGLKEGVQIHIFNLAGQLIKTAKPSESRWRWWVRQDRLPSGVYIYRLSDLKTKRAGKLVIIK
ncbi:MAG: Ig-like domain-containing protein [bacterium]|nr:Ig-like domain-containing protein [bacterium]